MIYPKIWNSLRYYEIDSVSSPFIPWEVFDHCDMVKKLLAELAFFFHETQNMCGNCGWILRGLNIQISE